MSKYNDNGRKWWRKRKAVTIIIDEFWNIPLWRGKNADGVHQCPKGPRAARSWAFVCHVPPEGAKRWRVIPWHGWWAIRFEPIDELRHVRLHAGQLGRELTKRKRLPRHAELMQRCELRQR